MHSAIPVMKIRVIYVGKSTFLNRRKSGEEYMDVLTTVGGGIVDDLNFHLSVDMWWGTGNIVCNISTINYIACIIRKKSFLLFLFG